MRLAAKIDANQKSVVTALRKAGVSVASLAPVGQGVPDLLCGLAGVNYLLEVKDGDKPKSAQKLTPDQVKWHEAWQGQVCVVDGPEQALKAIGVL